MRMFVAVDLDDANRAVVADAQRRALTVVREKSSLRPVDPQQVHVTLAFLGDVRSPLAERVVEEMGRPVADVAPFRLRIGGLGMFPARGAPRVLWLGLQEGAREMIMLQSAVARRLEASGVVLEDRAFHPHVTIARWRDARPSDRLLFEKDAARGAAAGMAVDRVTLFESRLSSKGASHFPLAHALLSPNP
jgi:RNA 2',3'-cyclic 3'-phosphodiesterase